MAQRKESKCVGVDMVESSNHLYSSKKATVEVTIKVKKQRHPSKHRDHEQEEQRKTIKPSEVFPKGSWGDLLSRKKSVHEKEIVGKEWKGVAKKDVHSEKIKCSEEGGEHPKSLCHKIPISSELYLETHTHVRSRPSSTKTPRDLEPKKILKTRGERERAKSSCSKPTQRNHGGGEGDDEADGQRKKLNYESQNDYLRYEIERLKQEIELVKLDTRRKSPSSAGDAGGISTSIIKRVGVPINKTKDAKSTQSEMKTTTFRKETRNTMTSTTNLNSSLLSSKSSGAVAMKSDSSRKFTPLREVATSTSVDNSEADLEKDLQLQIENEILRKQAAGLLAEMQKSKQEQQESIMTIKELYQLAELLKMENHKLIGAQEEQQQLQEKLVSAVTENQDLKQYLESIKNDSSVKKGVEMNQLEKIRNVIHEVKSTIREEIKGISTNDNASLAYRESMRGLDFNITEEGESALLSDTNASEIQRILGSYDDNSVM